MNQERLDELIDKYAFGTISPEELRELMDWYHSAEVLTVEWPTLEVEEKDHLQERMLSRLQTQIRAAVADGAGSAPRKRLFRIGGWQAAAACLAIVVASVWIVRQYMGHEGRPALVAVRNPSGKVQHVRLPDGSEVWLNAASTIRYSPEFGKAEGRPGSMAGGRRLFRRSRGPCPLFCGECRIAEDNGTGYPFRRQVFAGERLASVAVISGKVRVGDSARVLDVLTAASAGAGGCRDGKFQDGDDRHRSGARMAAGQTAVLWSDDGRGRRQSGQVVQCSLCSFRSGDRPLPVLSQF
ncbi:hypothetical protein ACQ86N_26280 [Puia sp. P3]|uniref:hypothetical protein n=1 Tax=Puia sp. P3 TaxID=3423952 RepID=UPI003D67BCBC